MDWGEETGGRPSVQKIGIRLSSPKIIFDGYEGDLERSAMDLFRPDNPLGEHSFSIILSPPGERTVITRFRQLETGS